MNFWARQRERINKTQAEIADSIGRTKALVSAWERDEAVPPLEHATALASAYRVKVARVLAEMQDQAKRIRKPRLAHAAAD
jgi:transcriptional regulator with XRE-family HTH domain